MARVVHSHETENEKYSDNEEEEREVDTAAAMKGLFTSKIAVLLLAIPPCFVFHFLTIGCMAGKDKAGQEACEDQYSLYNFIFNFCAIIPLAWLISEATEQLEPLVGDTWAVLLNSTFGNVVELILSVQAIRKGLVKIVQSSLLGAMLMNLLFVTGCCFLVSGVRKSTAVFNTHRAIYNLSLMGLATIALIVPTELANTDEWSQPADRMNLSLVVSGLLFLMYVQWLFFNIKTHNKLFETKGKKEKKPHHHHHHHDGEHGSLVSSEEDEDSDDDDEGPQMACWAAVTLLAGCTVLVAFHCDWLVDSINPVTESMHIHQAFVATVLLPMVGNFSEEIAAVSIASKGKIDLAMGVAIGSATQIALLIVPLSVFLSQLTTEDPCQYFDLDFEVFQVRLLLASVLVAALCLQDGMANWLKGTMMMTAYTILAGAFFLLSNEEFKSNEMTLRNRGGNSTCISQLAPPA